MDVKNFGEVLRQARQRSGEDIISVARRIRIRPDILEKIEASDLEGMPPRGYSRNMINAYARYLGLNPAELVKMYLDAQYHYQVEKARASLKSSESSVSTPHRQSYGRDRSLISDSTRSSSVRSGSATPPRSDFLQRRGLEGQVSTSEPPAATTRRIGSVHVGSFNAYGQGLSQRRAARSAEETNRIEPVEGGRQSGRSTRRRNSSSALSASPSSEQHFGHLYAAPSNLGVNKRSSALSIRAPFILAGVIVLLLAVLIVVMVNGMNRIATIDSSGQPLSVTGLPGSESTTQEDSSSEEETQDSEEETQEDEETAPTEVVIAYEVADGSEPYLEIQVDDEYVLAETISGPASESFEVTGTFEIVASPYEGLTVTQDGEEIDIEEYVSSNGIFRYSVDFQDVLDAWNEEHDSTSE